MIVVMLGKMLDGRGYQITSDNSDNIARMKVAADAIGATYAERESPIPGTTTVLFSPPARQ
ncbi:MAG: hypothetical protein WA728_22765 [Xanthobacteraceae bacterium]